MARTTGYTCAIVARQVASGLFARRGICPPEYLGQTPGCWEDLMAGYAARGIHVEHTEGNGQGSGAGSQRARCERPL